MKIIENKERKINLNINYEEFLVQWNLENILILHWWWWSSSSWLEYWEILSKNWFNVIIPDLPGFGKTKLTKVFNLEEYAIVIEEFCKEIWLNDFILMWHSNWGSISILLENRWNISIKKLVLNNSAGIRNDKKRNLKRKILNYISNNFDFFKNLKVFKKTRKLFYKIIWNQDYINAEKTPFLKETYQNIIKTDLQNQIKNIKKDTLLIRWEKDTYTPLSDAYFMRNNIKKSKLCILDNETHWIHLKNPKRLIETFLNNI